MRLRYLTVDKESKFEIIEKKSRFIASVKNINSETEAIEFYENIKKNCWDARHNVYAYYIGGEQTIQKFNDDGEPGGTAGMPMLETIKKMGIEDVVVVVTRYFGGILLGTGGLARAYSRSAREGIANCGIIEKILTVRYEISIDYTMLGKVQNMVLENNYIIISTDYSDAVKLHIGVPSGQEEEFKKKACELFSGDIAIREIDKDYYIMKEKAND